MPYTEADYEKAIIQLFEEMGYTHICGYDIDRDYKVPLYMDELMAALYRLNPMLPDDAISDALYKLQNFENGELVQKNAVFMDYLQNGIEVRYTDKGEERSAEHEIFNAEQKRLIDYLKANMSLTAFGILLSLCMGLWIVARFNWESNSKIPRPNRKVRAG